MEISIQVKSLSSGSHQVWYLQWPALCRESLLKMLLYGIKKKKKKAISSHVNKYLVFRSTWKCFKSCKLPFYKTAPMLMLRSSWMLKTWSPVGHGVRAKSDPSSICFIWGSRPPRRAEAGLWTRAAQCEKQHDTAARLIAKHNPNRKGHDYFRDFHNILSNCRLFPEAGSTLLHLLKYMYVLRQLYLLE